MTVITLENLYHLSVRTVIFMKSNCLAMYFYLTIVILVVRFHEIQHVEPSDTIECPHKNRYLILDHNGTVASQNGNWKMQFWKTIFVLSLSGLGIAAR